MGGLLACWKHSGTAHQRHEGDSTGHPGAFVNRGHHWSLPLGLKRLRCVTPEVTSEASQNRDEQFEQAGSVES